MGVNYCGKCGSPNPPNYHFCSSCGAGLFASIDEEEKITEDELIRLATEPETNNENSTKLKAKTEDSEKTDQKKGIGLWILIVIGIAIYTFGDFNDSSKDNKLSSELTDTDLILNIESYLKNNYLRDPDSYQEIEFLKTVYPGNVKNKYKIYSRFRAKNGFGGYNVEEKIFLLDEKGNVTAMFDVGE